MPDVCPRYAEGKRSGYMDMEMGAETAAAMVEASAERGSRAGGMEGGTAWKA